MAGISGTAVIGAAVVVGANGQLGVAPSSQRFKADIKAMDKTSEAIYSLKPVIFRYKREFDRERIPQFGLIAEEVEKVNPAVIARDGEGRVYSVRYDQVNAMLLNEFLKEHREVAEVKSTVAEQRKGMEAVAAQLKEQAAQIQKVSAQLEASRPVQEMVNNP
ncbi:MAG: tail fiber domain-containing protein [Candidatus Udaeobacter sp.]